MNIENSTRLSFTLMSEADSQLLFELDQNPEVMKYVNDGKPTTWQEIEQRFIPRLNAYRNPERGWGLWQVNLKDSDEFIGWILVRPANFFSEQRDDHNLELGWRFKQEFWGKGYATEAAQAVMDALATQPEVKAFSALAVPENEGSIRIMEKLGMTYIKTYVHEDSGISETVVYYQLDNN
ncbi:GNAT family N-acetyltransferase [Thalassotalea mangrovi]|uniref:GNAT family N-acetyltransferase n=1 Tax=Thalassotalea mangrovi TaxID=2572245 RepID=A0A4V6WMI9_9GAMM|nr:GNAT family N-acetyltransferase [Thalassotalea mangrovi]TKB43205.1 GNAT family N-acetyltransferase [Thalassotalea mangrovi]